MQNDASHLHPRSREGPVPEQGRKDGAAPAGAAWQSLSSDAYLLDADQVVRELKTDPDSGLSEDVAKTRLAEAGLNELQGGGGVSVVRILMGQIFNAMVMVSDNSPVYSSES